MTARFVIASFLLSLVLGPSALQHGTARWIPHPDFPGSGGPGGNFDWGVGDDFGGPQQRVILDTTYSVIVNEQQTAVETVIEGRIDVRNLTIHPNGLLDIRGPNPCVITATGEIRIDGQILLKGGNNLSVATLNTTNISEPGAPGAAGGGRGGTGNPRTQMSSEAGGPGFGAFGSVGRGGQGGESAYNLNFPNDSDDAHRRPAGGGGGTLGHDFLRPIGILPGYANQNLCPDQQSVGYDAEPGFSGYHAAIGVVTGSSPPRGGAAGPRPFVDDDRTNDFWGTMSTASGALIHGELKNPWAGAGGGGGGNAIVSNSFPTTPFDPGGDEKGAGGGGGGGSLTLLSLGPILFGQAGRIDASGGTGGGGENSFAGDITHIGGGSGGGSGGHVILQSYARIDFSICRTTSNPPGGIYALGGNGGAGKNDLGGSHPNGIPSAPTQDALPPNSYPSASAPCAVNGQSGQNPGYPAGFVNNTNPDGMLVVICAGGDGGPGIIQLHVPTPDGIVPPGSPGEDIYAMIKPPPVSSFPAHGAASFSRINTPSRWNLMFPQSGLQSQVSSMWMRLSGRATERESSAIELPSILVATSAAEPSRLAGDGRTIVIDAATVADDVYLRYSTLLRGSEFRITRGSQTTVHPIETAAYDEETRELRLSVATGEARLAALEPGDAVELRPRISSDFGRVLGETLPPSLQTRVEFQTAPDAPSGDLDLSRASRWTNEIAPTTRHLRFRISVLPREDRTASESPTPVPSLDFLHLRLGF